MCCTQVAHIDCRCCTQAAHICSMRAFVLHCYGCKLIAHLCYMCCHQLYTSCTPVLHVHTCSIVAHLCYMCYTPVAHLGYGYTPVTHVLEVLHISCTTVFHQYHIDFVDSIGKCLRCCTPVTNLFSTCCTPVW